MFLFTSRIFAFLPLSYVPLLLVSLVNQPIVAQQTHTPNETLVERVPGRKPPYPTRQQCYEAISPGQPPTDRAFYWTTPSGSSLRYHLAMEAYAEKHDLTHIFTERVWKTDYWFEDDRYQGTRAQSRAFRKNWNWAFAAHTRGKVYLLMPYGTPPREGSFWWTVEWPAIRDSGAVTEIVWIDGSLLMTKKGPPAPGGVTKTWWKRGDPQPSTFPPGSPPAGPPGIQPPGPPGGQQAGPPGGQQAGPSGGQQGGPPGGQQGGPPGGQQGGPPGGQQGGPPRGQQGGPPRGQQGGPPRGTPARPAGNAATTTRRQGLRGGFFNKPTRAV